MHDIEPWWGWRDEYTAENDPKSPFYGREYNEFLFTNKIYNYYIHPQWDFFGSETLYLKLIYFWIRNIVCKNIVLRLYKTLCFD